MKIRNSVLGILKGIGITEKSNMRKKITFNQMHCQIEQVIVVLHTQVQSAHGVTGFRSCEINGSVGQSVEIGLKGSQWGGGSHGGIHSGL